MPEGKNGFVFTIQRVAEAFRRAKATSVSFAPLADFERFQL